VKTSISTSQIVRRLAGFTLPEVMTASSLLIVLTGGVIYAFLFGLHLQRTAEIKLGANDAARKTLNTIVDEIRGATRVDIGTGSLTNFTSVSSTNTQVGSALRVYTAAGTNTWVRYYSERDPSSTNYNRLCRTTSATTGSYTVVVSHSMINTASLFSSEDSYGNPLNNNQNNRVIGINLQLYQVPFGYNQNSTRDNDFYQLRTRITRRSVY
jgi:hypothetical protein